MLLPDDIPNLPAHVPGELHWFKPGTNEYQEWLDQRESFLKRIEPSTPGGRAIIDDFFEALEKETIPTGWIGAVSMALRLTARARKTRKRRRLWDGVVGKVLQQTFTPPISSEEAFVCSFSQIQYIWTDEGGGTLLPDDYVRLYRVTKMRLLGGPLRNAILRYPRLDEYMGVMLRRFRDSYLHFCTMMDQG